MKAIVNVRLDSVGRVQSTKVIKSSGSFSFDRAVEVAIARSAPLPMPPESTPANTELQKYLSRVFRSLLRQYGANVVVLTQKSKSKTVLLKGLQECHIQQVWDLMEIAASS